MPCDNLPHREQLIEQSGPAQAILDEHLKIVAQPRPQDQKRPTGVTGGSVADVPS
jgi:hypothetical protein